MTAAAPRVLIAEDEPLVRELAEQRFEDAGFNVVAVGDGEAAVRLLAGDRRFDLIFTDVRMPGGVDGWALAQAARQAIPGVAVIYATGYSDASGAAVADSLVLRKPYRWAQLTDRIKELGIGCD